MVVLFSIFEGQEKKNKLVQYEKKKNIANVEPRYQMQKYLCVSTGDNYNSLLILPLEYVVNAKHIV